MTSPLQKHLAAICNALTDEVRKLELDRDAWRAKAERLQADVARLQSYMPDPKRTTTTMGET